MKLSTLLERIEQAVDEDDATAVRTRKYLARLIAASKHDGLTELDIKARMTKAGQKAVAEAPKVHPASEKKDDDNKPPDVSA